MEFAENKTLKPLYNYHLTAMKENQEEAREVEYEYHNGVSDPSREAAKLEKNLYYRNEVKAKKFKGYQSPEGVGGSNYKEKWNIYMQKVWQVINYILIIWL